MIQVKDNELNVKQWQCRLNEPTNSAYAIAKRALALFNEVYSWKCPVRAVTVRAINLLSCEEPAQINLFSSDSVKVNNRNERIDKTLLDIRSRFGEGIIKNAVVLNSDVMPSSDTPNTLPGGKK